MKQSIQLKFGQHLTMTPQLQQAIRLLQLSGIELQQEIQQALESNPMLESEDESGEEARAANSSSVYRRVMCCGQFQSNAATSMITMRSIWAR